jgi:hypothetical protein
MQIARRIASLGLSVILLLGVLNPSLAFGSGEETGAAPSLTI